MLGMVAVALIPDFLQLCEILCLIRGQFSGLPKHRFPHLLTPSLRPSFIYPQCFEQDILFGKHDADEVFQALAVVIGGVHMDMNAAGAVDLGTGLSYPAHTYGAILSTHS